MDFVKTQGGIQGYLPALKGRPVVNEDGVGEHLYFPRFNYNRKNNYHGGYIMMFGVKFNSNASGTGEVPNTVRLTSRAFASYTARASGCGPLENVCRITTIISRSIQAASKNTLWDPQVRFHVKNRDNDFKMMEDMFYWQEKVLRTCDADIQPFKPDLAPPGDATGECGGARMGNDPKTSVLNRFNQAHEIKNLFVVDASCFVSIPGSHGVTSTTMALAWRGCEYLSYLFRTGAIA